MELFLNIITDPLIFVKTNWIPFPATVSLYSQVISIQIISQIVLFIFFIRNQLICFPIPHQLLFLKRPIWSHSISMVLFIPKGLQWKQLVNDSCSYLVLSLNRKQLVSIIYSLIPNWIEVAGHSCTDFQWSCSWISLQIHCFF